MGRGEFVKAKLIAQFTDDRQPSNDHIVGRGEFVLARYLGKVEEIGNPVPAAQVGQRTTLSLRDYFVLTLDNNTIHLRGHAIEAGHGATCWVVRYEGARKVGVAMFDGSKIVGIYEGSKTPA